MKRAIITLLALATISGAIILVMPPFILPSPIYAAVYGWRYPKNWSVGDAQIVDNGPGTAFARFTVDIELPEKSDDPRKIILLANLPPEEFTVGLSIPTSGIELWSVKQEVFDQTTFEIRVSDKEGPVVASHKGLIIGEWTWSGPYLDRTFVYNHGSEFVAESTHEYELTILVKPAGVLPVGSTVRLLAGGWK